MRNIVIFTFLVVFTFTGYSQNAAIDSLKTLIGQTKSDTARINLKNDLIVKTNEVNLDSAIVLGQEVVREAEKIGYKRGKAQALRNMSTAFLMKGDFNKARQNLEDAKAIASTLQDSSLLVKIYSNYGMMYGMQSQYDSSRFYYKKAIDLSLRTGNKKNLGNNYGNLAISYQMQSNYPKALLYQQKSLKIAEVQNNINLQAYTSLNMGITYQKMGDTLRSETMLLHAVELAKKKVLKM